MPRVNIWIPEEDHKEVMKAKKAYGKGLGVLLVKLVKEDKERKKRGFHEWPKFVSIAQALIG